MVIKGCQNPATVGTNKKGMIKFSGVFTPDAAKDTNNFKVEVYKEFDMNNYIFKNLIAFKEGFIPKNMLMNGDIT